MKNSMVKEFLVGINAQFGASPVIIALSVLIIIFFVLFLVLINRIFNHRIYQRRLTQSVEICNKLKEKKQLSPSQITLIQELSRYTKEPEIQYPLFLDEHVFNHAVKEYLKDHDVPPELPGLRTQMGFRQEEDKQEGKSIYSTTQLNPGQQMILRFIKRSILYHGQVLSTQEDGFTVAIKESSLIPTESTIELEFRNPRGNYRSTSYIRKNWKTGSDKGDQYLHLLAHSEKIEKKQARNYFRKTYSESCSIENLLDQAKSMEGNFIDLGGGGASINAPDNNLNIGDLVQIHWKLDNRDFDARGKIIRQSKNKILHIEFEGLSEQKRDILFRELFRT